jgi:hypothetical protein
MTNRTPDCTSLSLLTSFTCFVALLKPANGPLCDFASLDARERSYATSASLETRERDSMRLFPRILTCRETDVLELLSRLREIGLQTRKTEPRLALTDANGAIRPLLTRTGAIRGHTKANGPEYLISFQLLYNSPTCVRQQKPQIFRSARHKKGATAPFKF